MNAMCLGNLHVLIVDDSLAVREWALNSLADLGGMSVSVSADAARALSEIASGEIDVVLLDVTKDQLDKAPAYKATDPGRAAVQAKR